MTVKLPDNVAVFGIVKATLADVKPGTFIGVGAMPQPDGSQKAIQVTIFAESQRGTGEGHRPWDRPGTTMTNATVDTTVTSVDGQVVMVKYKGGEQKILIAPDAIIRAYVVSSRDELKPGAHIAIRRALKKPDGTYEANRVNVGRDVHTSYHDGISRARFAAGDGSPESKKAPHTERQPCGTLPRSSSSS